jgi:hypothetical protein
VRADAPDSRKRCAFAHGSAATLANTMKSNRLTLKTRKPIDRLAAADLDAFPIWEFALDEEGVEDQDETWVRPVDANVVRKNSWSLSVAADFRTYSGVVIPGFIGVTTDGGVEIGHAVLLPKNKYVFVDANKPASRKATAKSVGLLAKELFPLTYMLRVRIGMEKTVRVGVIG